MVVFDATRGGENCRQVEGVTASVGFQPQLLGSGAPVNRVKYVINKNAVSELSAYLRVKSLNKERKSIIEWHNCLGFLKNLQQVGLRKRYWSEKKLDTPSLSTLIPSPSLELRKKRVSETTGWSVKTLLSLTNQMWQKLYRKLIGMIKLKIGPIMSQLGVPRKT